MEVFIGAVFLIVVLALLNQKAQTCLKSWLSKNPKQVFLIPCLLTILAYLVANYYGVTDPSLSIFAILAFAYTFIPTFIIFSLGNRNSDNPAIQTIPWVEFLVILLLWLPIEFAIWNGWLPELLGRSAHIFASGAAVTLGLVLFLTFMRLDGMKCNLPKKRSDFVYPLIGFAVAAVILIPLGFWLDFLGPFHIPPELSLSKIAARFAAILFGIALPEEILFRSLFQNWLMQKLGASNKTLMLSALIFGAAHLNNLPGPLPNWRYLILATVAGIIYGKVFQKSSSVFSSAGLHASVNTVRHLFFS